MPPRPCLPPRFGVMGFLAALVPAATVHAYDDATPLPARTRCGQLTVARRSTLPLKRRTPVCPTCAGWYVEVHGHSLEAGAALTT